MAVKQLLLLLRLGLLHVRVGVTINKVKITVCGYKVGL